MTFRPNCAEDYFTRGRHNNVNVIYIAQSYHQLPRHTIRQNSNFFVLFNQDNTALSHIYQDCFPGDNDILPYQKFKNISNKIWDDDNYNFITIDLTRNINQGKYRKIFNDYWIPLETDAALSKFIGGSIATMNFNNKNVQRINKKQDEINFIRKLNNMNEQIKDQNERMFFDNQEFNVENVKRLKPIITPLEKSIAEQKKINKTLSATAAAAAATATPIPSTSSSSIKQGDFTKLQIQQLKDIDSTFGFKINTEKTQMKKD